MEHVTNESVVGVVQSFVFISLPNPVDKGEAIAMAMNVQNRSIPQSAIIVISPWVLGDFHGSITGS
jgi:hypothetical protein